MKPLNIMYFHNHQSFTCTYHLVALFSIMLFGLTMSSCSSDDDFDSQIENTGDYSTSSQTSNIGIALNNFNANVIQATVEPFTRSAASEQATKAYASISSQAAWSSQDSDGGLSCDVTWGASSATRGPATGYTLQWGSIGSATQIAIQPRNYAATSYNTYTVSTSGAVSATTPYYFETASSDVITSWYPYNDGSLSSFAVQINQSTLTNYIASDLLYTSAAVTASSQSLTYSHKMAQIIVDVTVSNRTYLTNAEIQSLTISGLTTNCTTNFADLTGNAVRNPTFTTGSTTETITAYRYSSSPTATSSTSTATFIMCVPAQTISTSQVFTITVGGTAYTGKLTNAQTLASGCAYNVSITIDGKATMVYANGTIAVKDFYCKAGNGQAVIVKTAKVSEAKSKGITPLAVVFSTSTSSIDQGHGWSNGYAIALRDANSGNKLAWSTNISTSVQKSSHIYTTASVALSDLDGYDATHHITGNSSYNSTTYPAFFACVNYESSTAVPISSSGWYLPSNGQWMGILNALADFSLKASNTTSDYYFTCQTARDRINTCLANSGESYDGIRGTNNNSTYYDIYYWCSGEFSNSAGCTVLFDRINTVGKAWSAQQKSYVSNSSSDHVGWYYARPVIAF